MKATILTNTDIKQEWIDELKEYVDWDITIKKTSEMMPPKFNPYFGQVWGDFDWIRNKITTGDIKCFCTTKEELRNINITNHIGMYDMADGDSKHDFYIGLPDTLSKAVKKNGLKSNFVRLVLHEYLHGAEKQKGGPDRTHSMEDQGRLLELLEEHNKRIGLLKTAVNLLERLFGLLSGNSSDKQPTRLIHPVEEYRDLISQEYGVPNKEWYPQTGHHIGTDYACPVGTPVKAPWDGEVVARGKSASLGNYCIFEYEYEGVTYATRFLHLNSVPNGGSYKQGATIAKTGNTGNSTGAHLHIDVFFEEVRIDKLTPENYTHLTVDPALHFV